ncbi:NAD(P)-binding domain-containing protein [Actinoplanes oblitus]|uniref:NAD(P)-binding domain-containing protein n=1 Tax=Actinoplanes oblitus TaxID=3040509 RepID=A0ABY8WAV9_9ACTN|nr:NAD(P)-binding domain-containing protein [Actinoplanes oblitus]WIM93583.1 NAD(P)-binding domain-containing protein [Actinoplanes oblitus]
MTHHKNANSRIPAVAVLGLGPMGRALAAASLAAGHPTVLWNRSPDKAAPLVARGASVAATPAEAARRASVVLTCVVDYEAARAVVAGLASGSTAMVVNLSSGHAAQARDMASWAAGQGIDYLDGAIVTPAPTIGTPAASILYSGPRALYDRSAIVRESLGAGVYLGADAGTAAAYEMALLDLFTMCVGGLAHAFALAAAEGISPEAFARFARGIGHLLPDMSDRFADQLSTGSFSADVSSIASAGSAIAHVRAAASARDLDTAPLRAVQSIIDRAVAAGYGDDSYARLAQSLSSVGRTVTPIENPA